MRTFNADRALPDDGSCSNDLLMLERTATLKKSFLSRLFSWGRDEPAHAQAPPVFQTETDVVNPTVTVRDAAGRFVPDLTRDGR